ncbi:hypothetical protein GOBAR_AA33847 [Gossypium barbadense]|uniref:E1 ubiquitin-activating enzyme n=1 Tax=Gossypium barbadense TaxID=3634 RepID=A0A2P5W6V2_GOSBA|nr:hypothetical protein GOBAR_AA33847 [Gossypium barbadense]
MITFAALTIVFLGFYGIFGSLMHYMLPRKRAGEGEVVEEESENNNSNIKDVTVSPPIKKHRISTTDAADLTADNKIVTTGDNSSNYSNTCVDEPSVMASRDVNHNDIDEDLHSRQLAAYGRETMRRLFASNILISGMQGLGAEIAKNLILAGVKSVTLHDEGVVEMWDLSSSFVFSENDVGKNRALASLQKLQELNNAVVISTITTTLTKQKLSDFQAVVFTDISLEKSLEYNDYCHNHQPPISFIKTEVRGLFGTVFCDFGPKFTVFDVDGEEPHTGIIASISNDNPALVSCVDDERLEFEDGDLVVFSEIQGMKELNDGKPRKIKSVRPYSFTLEEDTTNFGTYVKGGIVTQVKQPRVLNFKPLRAALKDPGDFLLSDFSKFDRPPLLHIAFQALDRFICEIGRFPVARSEEDAQKFISIAGNINECLGEGGVEDINPKLLTHFAFGARAVLNPMAAMFGGIVGQEVVKALESLPVEPLDPIDFKPLNNRYDAQISVFGSKLQKNLEDAKVFIVGSGALGCEFLKNVALMGVSCGSQGKLTITDDDLKIEALQNRVGPETEFVFNDDFWENLTVVINALDNVDARLYVDQRCLYFQKPLLELGTLGAKCNTQMVIPHLTENYGASRDPPEKQAPMCTVHSFPHNIDHCLTWARSEFEGLLEKTPAELTFTFPEDATTSTGAPFWSAPKRFPRPLQFSTTDPSHLQFIMAASILRAETFGIPVPDWVKNTKMLAKAVEKVIVPDFQPKEGVKIETIETDERATSLSTGSVDDAAVINELLFKLERSGLANMRARNYSIPEVDKLKAKFIAGRIIPAIATSTAMATGLVCLELYKVLDGAHKVEDYVG